MILVLLLLSFLVTLFCGLLLFYSGRSLHEKLSIFFLTPQASGRDEGLITIIRFIFWVSFIVSAWFVIKLCQGRGSF